MKHSLLLALVLLLANSFISANAQTCTNSATLKSASGSPSVVIGTSVDLEVVIGTTVAVAVYLDGDPVLNLYPTDKPATVATKLTVPVGSHTLQSGTCAATTFTVVPALATPGTPVLSTSAAAVSTGQNYTLSWTVPDGSIDHYTLSKNNGGTGSTTSTLPGSATSVTFASPTGQGVDRTFFYMIRACSSSDESNCGAWSNTVEVDVYNGCTRVCQ